MSIQLACRVPLCLCRPSAEPSNAPGVALFGQTPLAYCWRRDPDHRPESHSARPLAGEQQRVIRKYCFHFRVVSLSLCAPAGSTIAETTCIGAFTGLLKQRQQDDTSKYLIPVVSEGSLQLDIDAELFGNELRFINDYSGRPNLLANHGALAAQSVLCRCRSRTKCQTVDLLRSEWSPECADRRGAEY